MSDVKTTDDAVFNDIYMVENIDKQNGLCRFALRSPEGNISEIEIQGLTDPEGYLKASYLGVQDVIKVKSWECFDYKMLKKSNLTLTEETYNLFAELNQKAGGEVIEQISEMFGMYLL